MQINEDIRDREVRVVTDGGEQLGIMSAKEALKRQRRETSTLLKYPPTQSRPFVKSWITANTVLSSQSAKRKTEKPARY